MDLLHLAAADDAHGGQRQGLVPGVMAYEPGDDAHPGHRLWWDLMSGTYTFHLRLSARDVPSKRYVARCAIEATPDLGSLARQLAAVTVQRA